MTLHTKPPLPGAVLKHQILNARNVKQSELASAMGVSRVRICQIVNGRAPITPEMALRIARVTDTSAEYWLRLQMDFDLLQASSKLQAELESLPKICAIGIKARPRTLRAG